MATKKASSKNDVNQPAVGEPADELPRPGLDDLEAHISQRITQLENTDGSPDPLLDGGNAGVDSASPMPPFEAFEGYELAALHGGETAYAPSYEHVREAYQESGEIIKSIHNLSDCLTESVLNLNVRLNELEEKLGHLNEQNSEELRRLKLLIKEVHKSIPTQEPAGKAAASVPADKHSVADYMNELQKQVEILKVRMDRNVSEIGQKLDDRQTAFMNVLDTRVKVMEKVSVGYKEHLSRNFFNLAILVILICITAGLIIMFSVDHMSYYVCQQLDSLRVTLQQFVEASRSPGQTP